MNHKGQIVQIPEDSLIYKNSKQNFDSLKDEMLYKINQKKYSLFDGFIVGGHFGLNDFVLGQRKGINIGGQDNPLYVIAKDEKENRLFVGAGQNHPGLFSDVFEFSHYKIEPIFECEVSENSKIKVCLESLQNHQKYYAIILIFDEMLYLKFNQSVKITLQEQSFKIYNNKQFIGRIN